MTQITNKKLLARVLGISRSSLYYKPKKPQKDWEMKTRIEDALHEHPSYGHKRLALYLKVNKKRVHRVMKLFGLRPYRIGAKKQRRYRKTAEAVYPNLLRDTPPQYPHHIWVSDFTHVVFQGKNVYIATVMDLMTRSIVGCSVLTGHPVSLVMGALMHAVSTTRKTPTLIHSDQGSEYNCREYTDLARSCGIQISMSRKGSPWENGYQESFYGKFKTDLGDPNRFSSLGELVYAIYQTIHDYNTTRIHTALKTSPLTFLENYYAQAQNAGNGC